MLFVEANGAKIPAIGLGTWELRGRQCARIVEQALKLGYRHIDTAQVYENEREVGDGLRASGVRRDDVFVTTKVWTTHFAPHELERAGACQENRSREAYRRFEFHGGADRGGDEGMSGAAGLRSGRIPSLSRPGQSPRGLRAERHGARRL